MVHLCHFPQNKRICAGFKNLGDEKNHGRKRPARDPGKPGKTETPPPSPPGANRMTTEKEPI